MREFSGLAHLPIPGRYPRYLSRDQVVEYLRDYVHHFNLRVISGVTITRIRPADREWELETAGGESWHCRVAVIATGQYRDPVVPPWPGRESYHGRLTHSSEYRNAGPYENARVLVVGAGNSGAEIATDLAEGGAGRVAISIRTPPPIVPRDPFGLPVQRTSILLSALPPGIADRIGATTARLALGDLSRHGMPKGVFTPYTRRQVPLIDVGFVAALKRGAVAVKPAVEALWTEGAAFAGGTREPFDAIVAATGFASGLAGLVDAAGVLDASGEPTGRSGEPTGHRGLYFMGFTHSLRGHLFEANRASRRLARHVEHDLACG